MLSRLSSRRFGLYSLFGMLSPSSAGIRVGSYPPARPVPEHAPMEKGEEATKLQGSKLKNGVLILTESTQFPSAVSVGVSIATGTRDEDMDHSGICFALKNTFLKTNSRTNEQINYCMLQMSGGNFCMKYDQESLYYGGHMLAHDTYDLLQMTADIVLDEKTIMDEETSHWRADEFFKLRELNQTHQTVIADQWLTVAYGLNTLGLPLEGFHSKFQNIGYSHMNHFREHYATPDRMIVMGSGINNHEEFVHAVAPYFMFLEPKKAHERQPAKYLGGEVRYLSEESATSIHLSFQAPSYGSADYPALTILKEIMGFSCCISPPSTTRAYTHFMQKNPFALWINQSHAGFSDSGNWGLNVSGTSNNAGKLADALTTELLDLTKVTDQEVARAKNRLLVSFATEMACPQARMERFAKGIRCVGKAVTQQAVFEKTAAVTAEQVRALAAKLLQSRPTMIVQGGNTHDVPSLDKMQARLK